MPQDKTLIVKDATPRPEWEKELISLGQEIDGELSTLWLARVIPFIHELVSQKFSKQEEIITWAKKEKTNLRGAETNADNIQYRIGWNVSKLTVLNELIGKLKK